MGFVDRKLFLQKFKFDDSYIQYDPKKSNLQQTLKAHTVQTVHIYNMLSIYQAIPDFS